MGAKSETACYDSSILHVWNLSREPCVCSLSDFIEVEDFSEHLLKELKKMQNEEESEKRRREIDRCTCKVGALWQVYVQGGCTVTGVRARWVHCDRCTCKVGALWQVYVQGGCTVTGVRARWVHCDSWRFIFCISELYLFTIIQCLLFFKAYCIPYNFGNLKRGLHTIPLLDVHYQP